MQKMDEALPNLHTIQHPALHQTIQQQSITSICNQYHDSIGWIRQYHNDHFATYQYRFKKPRSASQPSWTQLLSGNFSMSSPPLPPPSQEKKPVLGKTRAYRTRSLVPGFCNQERTFSSMYKHPIPKTPSDLYKRPNINRDDRFFSRTNQTIRLFQFTQQEWIQHARECLKTSSTVKFNKCEPLMTYIRHVIATEENANEKSNEKEPEPNIFGPKLTDDQKDELLDAYYWVHVHSKRDATHKTVLFYYKLYGWYVRAKDGYQKRKSDETRQLNIKRQKLIKSTTGTVPVQVQTKLKLDENRVKSTRGRKPKQNV